MGTAARIDEHLAGCPACCEYYEGNDDISELISKCDEVVHPGSAYLDSISGKVIENLFDESGAFKSADLPSPAPLPRRLKRWRLPLWMTGGIAAAGLVVLGLGPIVKGNLSSFSISSLAEDLGIFAPRRAPDVDLPDGAARFLEPQIGVEITSASDPSPVQIMLIEEAARIASANPLSLTSSRATGSEQEISKSVRRSEMDAQAADAARRRAFGGTLTTPVDSAQRPPKLDLQNPGIPMNSPDLAPRILEELVLAQTMDPAESRDRLMAILQELTVTTQDQAAAATLTKQLTIFRQGQIDYEAGRFERAIQNFYRTYSLDPSTAISCRASMALADIWFYEYGDFSQAKTFYERCKTSGMPEALSPKETEHLAKQLEILDRYRINNWAALRALYSIGRDSWGSMAGTLGYLAWNEDCSALMPEAVRTMLDRFQNGETDQAGDRPSDSQVLELVDLIEKAVPGQQNSESKAWLQFASGELIWIRFKNVNNAMQAYEKTLALNEESLPGQIAAKRIRQIREENLGEIPR